jgi:hypothetical protein
MLAGLRTTFLSDVRFRGNVAAEKRATQAAP